jgi:hypothetical protein
MTVSRVERGDTAALQLRTVTAVAAALEAQLSFDLRWRGGELPRTLNAGHAAMHEVVAMRLHRWQWLFAPEVSFSIYGERGIIDILAFHPGRRALLVVELKTQVVDIQGLIGAVDRYRRLAPRIARTRGWQAATVSTWLALRGTDTNRRHVAAHGRVLGAAFPASGSDIRAWLKDPVGAINGLGFVSYTLPRGHYARFAGIQRVRAGRPSVARPQHDAGAARNEP